jgi:hypothetical protein
MLFTFGFTGAPPLLGVGLVLVGQGAPRIVRGPWGFLPLGLSLIAAAFRPTAMLSLCGTFFAPKDFSYRF